MTTDITELAQSLKAAAENAIGAHERLAAYPYGEIIDISKHEGEQIDIDITALNALNSAANPTTVLALLDELEAAEKRIAELEARTVTLPQYRNSPDMHTKQFYEAIGFNQGLDIFIEALRAAGIGKGE
ncbi:TPA: ead/Ea22-like family protein [Raoultella ornithinolytica]|nr:ead/Ea22-like family protein [Raoultella ornithinolytica]HAT2372499.1 ead/Ea22-like family protein [Raoultella ornithinolytica]HCD1183101.1 ead/Ea22-like family protein [Raoultella ornithinolytica]HCU0234542.1 ead/Ea22-like family protein [Klebsiella pneumoniae]